MLASPIAKPYHFPNSPHFFIVIGLQKIQSKTKFLKETRSYNLQVSCLLTLATECFIACIAQTAQKTASKCGTRIKIYNNPNPLEFNQASPNAYQLIALCLCNKLTPPLTETSLIKKVCCLNGSKQAGIIY